MRKDPTEFRQRFQRWKNGERVYDGGKPAATPSAIDLAITNLVEDEGFRSNPYVDKASRSRVMTAGYGFTDPHDIHKWTELDAQARLRELVTQLDTTARTKSWGKAYIESSPEMQAEILNLMYLGGSNVIDRKMPKFKAAYTSGDYAQAARELDFGRKQSPNRTQRRQDRFTRAVGVRAAQAAMTPVSADLPTVYWDMPDASKDAASTTPIILPRQIRQALFDPESALLAYDSSVISREILESELAKRNPGMFLPTRLLRNIHSER